MIVSQEHIIEEIKRTAQANGGEPLGVNRFFQETGIKESDWSGKFWVRWGDALIASGYSPNSLTIAYSNDFLVESLIRLIRILEHYPTSREIKLHVRNNSGFPSPNVFARRGKKTEWIKMVIEYCSERCGYDDVIAICEPLVSQQKPVSKELTEDDEEFGFVYLMKSGQYYKIGRSKAVGRREYELAIQLPEKLTTIHKIKTDDSFGIEAYWHNRFKEKRQNGEWFELSARDIKVFKRRTFM